MRLFASYCPSLTQLSSKIGDYLAKGMHLGWLIDPQTPLVDIYRPSQEVEMSNFSFEQPPTRSGEEVLPGFVLL